MLEILKSIGTGLVVIAVALAPFAALIAGLVYAPKVLLAVVAVALMAGVVGGMAYDIGEDIRKAKQGRW